MNTREEQFNDDAYYMHIADAVECGANCLGSQVGAVLVRENRLIGAGYNGTPSGFPNCNDHGCVRCLDSWLYKRDRRSEMSDTNHTSGQALDRCICVHAEQNAFITAARFGIRVDGSTLYTTQSPCFGCLKEAMQAGVHRVVYGKWYEAQYNDSLKRQYLDLVNHFTESDPTRFEELRGRRPPLEIVETRRPLPHAV